MRRSLAALLLLGAVGAGLWLARDRGQAPAPRERVGGVAPVRPERPPGSRASADAEAAPAPAPRPRRRRGETFTHELIEAPRDTFGPAPWSESDRKYAADVEDLDAVEYDPALGRVARELAVFYSVEGAPAPTELLQFIVNAAGASEWGVLQTYLTTTEISEATIARRVRQLADTLPDSGAGARVGVGESYTVGPRPERVVAVVVSRGGLYLDPLRRRVRAGEQLTLTGALPPGAQAPALVTMGADHRFVEAEVRQRGERFSVSFEAPRVRGPLLVELVARLANGPTPLAQLELHVDEPLPESLTGAWPPDESEIDSDVAAAAEALALLDADRARYGLPPLVEDPLLSRVARAHSRDMRDNDFFGHLSATTGGPSDRLRRAGYGALMSAENVAANSSLWDAEAGLFYSLGHRKNILCRDATHVGVGVASRQRHGRTLWLVTQLFAKPAPEVVVADARAALLERLEEAARAAGAEIPRVDRGLARQAQAEAEAPEPCPREALERAEAAGLTGRGAYAWTARVGDPATLTVPAELLDRGYPRVGVGVDQRPGLAPPNVFVVLIFGG